MYAIRIHRKIDSETLHIPDLRPLIGREVEIIILDDQPAPTTPSPLDGVDSGAFWRNKSVEELIQEQGVKPYKFSDPAPFTAEDFEGFDEALEEWRKE